MKYFIFVLSLTFAAPLFAQNPKEDREDKIEALRIAYITQELSLTPEESQKFWPVFNEFKDKLKALKKESRKLMKKGVDAMTDEELQNFLEADLALDEKEIALRREYLAKFKQVISIRKIVALRNAEREFMKKMLDRMKDKN